MPESHSLPAQAIQQQFSKQARKHLCRHEQQISKQAGENERAAAAAENQGGTGKLGSWDGKDYLAAGLLATSGSRGDSRWRGGAIPGGGGANPVALEEAAALAKKGMKRGREDARG